ncbi:2,5-diamino-6-(ribosylamino)-4(3H)-pyrimidinone 5'-phosphate reductase [Tulasnella sp. JGI-2019a]|nr:2,5-diamino-6-(ribosylamino)-4(3H)-pyrimidinone 5'-phosphate reductase [Tulasnella sp. JGI-2019a]
MNMAEPLKVAQSFLDNALGDINSNDNLRKHPERPYVTLTYAQSLDSKIAGKGGVALPLSGDESWLMTHWMRTMHDGIMVGINTVINDNPGLAPSKLPPRNDPYSAPTPIILDTYLRISTSSKVISKFQSGEGKRPCIVCRDGADPAKKAVLEALDVTIYSVGVDQRTGTHPCFREYGPLSRVSPHTIGRLDIKQVLAKLAENGVRSLMVEGGSAVISQFLSAKGIVDSVIITVSPMWVGNGGIPAMNDEQEPPKLEHIKSEVMGKDTVVACRLVQS